MAGTPHCIWPLGAQLGEGPVWSAAERSIWFVDIKRQRIHCYQLDAGAGKSWDAPSPPGFLAPIAGGKFVVGLKTGLHRFDPVANTYSLLATVERPELNNRINDGHVDAKGRLWFGTMHDDEVNATGALYRLTADQQLLRVDENYCVTNGPAMSPDGRTLYHADTVRRSIYAFDVSDDGHLSNKRVFTRITKPNAWPDGLCVDMDGYVWVALYGGWGLERYSPRGELSGYLRLPCTNVTKASFGDDDLRTLYVTTASHGLSGRDRALQPLAGGLFAMRVDTPGLPQHNVEL